MRVSGTNHSNSRRFAKLHGASWLSTIESLFGAATRLHHYRDIRTQMMRDALCNLECRPCEDNGVSE